MSIDKAKAEAILDAAARKKKQPYLPHLDIGINRWALLTSLGRKDLDVSMIHVSKKGWVVDIGYAGPVSDAVGVVGGQASAKGWTVALDKAAQKYDQAVDRYLAAWKKAQKVKKKTR